MMTRIALTILISLLSFLSKAQEVQKEANTTAKGITIEVTVPKIASNTGKVYFALYDSKNNFLQRIPFQKATGEIKENSTSIRFVNVPKGTYAITCFHDANDNQKMDFEQMRPVEDYGSSNNPQFFGPPQFDLAKFEVNDIDLNMEIRF